MKSDLLETGIRCLPSKVEIMEYFLDRSITSSQIADKLGVPLTELQEILTNSDLRLSETSHVEKRIEKLFLRERIKDTFRRNPYLGAQKVCEKLGVTLAQYQDAYETLLNLGELTFDLDRPLWATEGKVVRKHAVVKI